MIRKYAAIFCWKNVSSFCSAKATHIFSAKNIRILCIESTKTVNEITLNELVKLMTLWTTGPRSFQLLVDVSEICLRVANSVALDQTPQNADSDPGLKCLHLPIRPKTWAIQNEEIYVMINLLTIGLESASRNANSAYPKEYSLESTFFAWALVVQ